MIWVITVLYLIPSYPIILYLIPYFYLSQCVLHLSQCVILHYMSYTNARRFIYLLIYLYIYYILYYIFISYIIYLLILYLYYIYNLRTLAVTKSAQLQKERYVTFILWKCYFSSRTVCFYVYKVMKFQTILQPHIYWLIHSRENHYLHFSQLDSCSKCFSLNGIAKSYM